MVLLVSVVLVTEISNAHQAESMLFLCEQSYTSGNVILASVFVET